MAAVVSIVEVKVNPPDKIDEWVIRAKAGDQAAFEEIVRATSRLVFAKLFLDTGDRHQADDILQETFLLAWRSLKSLKDAATFRPWLLSIAHRAMLDFIKKDSRKKRSGPRADSPLTLIAGQEAEPSEQVGRAESRQQVLNVLRGLPEQYRLPLSLRYLAGCDYQSIGQQLGITNGSLQGLLHRGLKLLRERLPNDFE